MLNCFTKAPNPAAIPITPLIAETFSAWLEKQSPHVKHWLNANQFSAQPDTYCIIPSQKGYIEQVVIGLNNIKEPWFFAQLATSLPDSIYALDLDADTDILQLFALMWGLQRYQFQRYRKNGTQKSSQLVLPEDIDEAQLTRTLNATFLVRDLINTPADDMGPAELAQHAEKLAKHEGGKIKHIVGQQLIKENYPAIYAVGRASDREPRLIDFTWGDHNHRKVTLVGKGVCFDTGGLDLKPAQAMRLMKKDMGGAAHVLALAQMIMAAKLPIYLRVLIPAVDNAVSGIAYRPGDIVMTRKGISVEIGNTDAEGRVVLADALTEAAQAQPDLIIDFATLTGAARVALGTDVPALFTNDDTLAKNLLASSAKTCDPLWQMPLHTPYRSLLNSPIADMNNVGDDSYGGAIIAALFLNEFIPATIPWAHIDLMAWNLRARPARPEGGEAMGLRAVYDYLATANVRV